jgi:hypothetical protein
MRQRKTIIKPKCVGNTDRGQCDFCSGVTGELELVPMEGATLFQCIDCADLNTVVDHNVDLFGYDESEYEEVDLESFFIQPEPINEYDEEEQWL